MILQKTYHKLQEWIIMLSSPEFKNTDADIVRDEMMSFAGEIWLNKDIEISNKIADLTGKLEGKK